MKEGTTRERAHYIVSFVEVLAHADAIEGNVDPSESNRLRKRKDEEEAK